MVKDTDRGHRMEIWSAPSALILVMNRFPGALPQAIIDRPVGAMRIKSRFVVTREG